MTHAPLAVQAKKLDVDDWEPSLPKQLHFPHERDAGIQVLAQRPRFRIIRVHLFPSAQKF